MSQTDHNAPAGLPASTATSRFEPGTAAPSGTRTGRWLVLLFILIVLGLAAGFIPRWRHKTELINETRDLAIATVNVVSPVPGNSVSTLVIPAEVRAVVEAPIYARASGYVKKWYHDIGAPVKSGEPLVDIDTPELDQELTGAKAGLAQAEAALGLSKSTALRWAELLKTSSVAEQENAEKQADLKLKEANLDAAKANVRRYQDLQSFTHVTAPFNGSLTLRDIDVGDLISPGKELFRLADTSKLRVFVRVPQSAAPGIATGLDAELTVPELPARKFPAKVVRTAGAIDAVSRTLLAELEVDNPNNEILAGSYAQVRFMDLKHDPALVLPSNTLLFRAEGPQVGVVKADGKVELRSVILGRDFGRTLEILSGITGADQVIINPPDALVSGVAVRVASAPKPEIVK